MIGRKRKRSAALESLLRVSNGGKCEHSYLLHKSIKGREGKLKEERPGSPKDPVDEPSMIKQKVHAPHFTGVNI